jgi:DNA-binding MarR family transcriptional regulator
MTSKDMSEITMFQACLMHSRAERILKTIVAKHLKKYELTRMEWIVLAALDSNPAAGGYSMSELSRILDIKLSQLTILTSGVLDKDYAKQVTSAKDKRTKLITITPKGSKLIASIEKSMRQAMHEWLQDIPREKLKAYMETLVLLGNEE